MASGLYRSYTALFPPLFFLQGAFSQFVYPHIITLLLCDTSRLLGESASNFFPSYFFFLSFLNVSHLCRRLVVIGTRGCWSLITLCSFDLVCWFQAFVALFLGLLLHALRPPLHPYGAGEMSRRFFPYTIPLYSSCPSCFVSANRT